jgi:CheY-like chemotaxis protein
VCQRAAVHASRATCRRAISGGFGTRNLLKPDPADPVTLPEPTETELLTEPPLVVEDESYIAMDLALLLEERGWRVLGPAITVAQALTLLGRQRPDVALLDVRLDGETMTPLAELLRQWGMPFVLCSTDRPSADAPLAGVPNIGKPFTERVLFAELDRALAASR